MGVNIGSMTTIFLGIGLGILAISCLTVTIVFGRYTKDYPSLQKYQMKLMFYPETYTIDASIAIAVFGCISAASAIVAIVFSFLFEDKSLLMIIIGGVSSFFAFGCIISEGVYTQKAIDVDLIEYDNENLRSHSHKSARNYIKKSIELLYKQAKENLEKKANEENKNVSIPSWSDIKKKLGTVHYSGNVITYSYLWGKKNPIDEVPLTLYLENSVIKAHYSHSQYDNIDDTEVATCIFKTQYSQKKNLHACWYNNDNTSLSCKDFKGETVKGEVNVLVDYIYYDDDKSVPYYEYVYLNEYIVVGHYYSLIEEERNRVNADYLVSRFPFAFKTFSYDQFQKFDQDLPVAEDSSKHFKVKGKKWAKLIAEEKIDSIVPNDIDADLYITPKKPNSYQNAFSLCNEYLKNNDDENYICYNYTDFDDDIKEVINYYYKDSNKGKVPPYIVKHYKSEAKKFMNSLKAYPGLYDVALMNLIIQIFGIIFWACGMFIPNGKDKMPSEGEA